MSIETYKLYNDGNYKKCCYCKKDTSKQKYYFKYGYGLGCSEKCAKSEHDSEIAYQEAYDCVYQW